MTKEVLEICGRLGDNKAAGLDDIPNKALNLAVKSKSDIFVELFEACLADGIFPLAGIGVPSYLTELVDSYLTDKNLQYNTDNGIKEYIVPVGIPQGFVLGPLLRNIIYNDVLNLPAASDATIVDYANDIVVIVVAKDLADVELYSSVAITAIKK